MALPAFGRVCSGLARLVSGLLMRLLDIERRKVGRTVKPGEDFQFVFGFGDNWVHCCTVGTAKIDPLQTLGIVPAKALPYWGWGGPRTDCGTGPGLWSHVRQG